MNILFVGMYPDEYMPYRNVFFQNLIFAMADAGVECTVISPVPVTRYRKNLKMVSTHRVDKTPKGSKVNVYHPRYISLSSKHIGSFNTGIWSEKLFQNCALKMARKMPQDFDAVYGHFFLSGGLAAIKIARERKKPSFIANGECNYQSEIINLYRELNVNDLKGLSGIIAVSTNNANTLKSKSIYNDIPILIAPNSVDKSLFFKQDKEKCRVQLGMPLDAFIVGFVGGFIDRKGDKRVLSAIETLDGVYGAFAGKGNNPPTGSKVLFCKALNHEDVPVFLNAIDVFCLPTLNEGSCNAIVEAASCGVPVISSDLPFNDDLLTRDNSIRINPNSVEEINLAIKRLYFDAHFRNTIADRIYDDSKPFSINERQKKIYQFMVSKMENDKSDKQ